MKLRKFIYGGGAAVCVIIVFALDVIRKSVAIEIAGPTMIRDVLLVGAFILVYALFELTNAGRTQTPVKILGLVLVATIIIVVISLGVETSVANGFDAKEEILSPLDYGTLFVASLLGLLFGIFAIFLMRALRDLVLYKRRKNTKRNLVIFVVLMLGACASSLFLKPLEKSVITTILFALAVAFAIANSFRQSWIVYLTKREKVFSLIYTFFLFLGFIALNIVVNRDGVVTRSLQYYSLPVMQLVSLACIFGNTYFGMAFVSTLFHLPTAEAFERKTSEVSSLHNLSRLTTQVFDFNELVETVTSMMLQVVEANSSWLEILYSPDDGRPVPADEAVHRDLHIVAMQNITREEIAKLLPRGARTVRDRVIEDHLLIHIDDMTRDGRFSYLVKSGTAIRSLVVAPLVSHNGLVGILYAAKTIEYGFFKDDIDVITTFADQATVAIENSRLIKKSIERERLMREMILAQEMQKKLLPQRLPEFTRVEMEAISTPAFEVGGDYYDVITLDSERIGICVGDVSGKGVSAAFYMSEVKGIFQAIGPMYPSPREFMIKANEALSSSIDKHSFVSLIYAVIEASSGMLTISRAGHCPMLYLSGEHASYIRPGGMGMGMSRGSVFANAIEETTIRLKQNDVCIFYTDGVTEARNQDDEFGYDRLVDAARAASTLPAAGIKEAILGSIREYLGGTANHDDLTLVVVKWLGSTQPH